MKNRATLLAAGILSAAALALGAILPAAAANDHTLPPTESSTEINPCTGLPVTVTEVYKTAVFHISTDASGGVHLTGTANGTISTSDGFSGRFTLWFGGKLGGANGLDQNHFTFSATLHNGTGMTVNVHSSGHFIVKDGVPVKTVENNSATCVGKP